MPAKRTKKQPAKRTAPAPRKRSAARSSQPGSPQAAPAHPPHPDHPECAPVVGAPVCGARLPAADASCVLPANHGGQHSAPCLDAPGASYRWFNSTQYQVQR